MKYYLPPEIIAKWRERGVQVRAEWCEDKPRDEYWHIALVAPGSEDRTIRQFVERGFDAFRPAKVCYRKTHRTVRSQQKRPVEYPLFPRYVFVAVENYEGLSELWRLEIVQEFLGSRRGGRLRPRDMRRLREMDEEAPPEQVAMISREEYEIGRLCDVIYGPVKGQQLIVVDITGNGKNKPWVAHVQAQFFRSKYPVEVPLDWLVPA